MNTEQNEKQPATDARLLCFAILVSDLFFRPIRILRRILNVYFMKTANILVYGYITVHGYVLNN